MTPPLVTSPLREPQTQMKKFFFQSQLEDLLNPQMVWIAF